MKHLQLFGKNLKFHRKNTGFTQEELAAKCGFHRTYIGMLESGKRNPSLMAIIKLAKAIDVEVVELLEGINYDS